MTDFTTCRIGSCHRHEKCMYSPCRNTMVIVQARQQGKTLAGARERVRAVAQGATINGTYKLLPEASLEAFRADLIRILAG